VSLSVRVSLSLCVCLSQSVFFSGIFANGCVITLQSPEYVYVASRISHILGHYFKKRLSSGDSRLKFLEIGAGYGGTARFFLSIFRHGVGEYTVIDLPVVNVLQGYYLAKSIGYTKVRLNGEKETDSKSNFIHVLPTNKIYEKNDIDVLFNQNSMPEIPFDVVVSYLKWARDNVELFYSYNYEALTAKREYAVVTVPEVISHVGGFNLENRAPSWVRPGYVEEIYLTERYRVKPKVS